MAVSLEKLIKDLGKFFFKADNLRIVMVIVLSSITFYRFLWFLILFRNNYKTMLDTFSFNFRIWKWKSATTS